MCGQDISINILIGNKKFLLLMSILEIVSLMSRGAIERGIHYGFKLQHKRF